MRYIVIRLRNIQRSILFPHGIHRLWQFYWWFASWLKLQPQWYSQVFQDTISTAGVDALGSVGCYPNISWAQRVNSASPFLNHSFSGSVVCKFISHNYKSKIIILICISISILYDLILINKYLVHKNYAELFCYSYYWFLHDQICLLLISVGLGCHYNWLLNAINAKKVQSFPRNISRLVRKLNYQRTKYIETQCCVQIYGLFNSLRDLPSEFCLD